LTDWLITRGVSFPRYSVPHTVRIGLHNWNISLVAGGRQSTVATPMDRCLMWHRNYGLLKIPEICLSVSVSVSLCLCWHDTIRYDRRD